MSEQEKELTRQLAEIESKIQSMVQNNQNAKQSILAMENDIKYAQTSIDRNLGAMSVYRDQEAELRVRIQKIKEAGSKEDPPKKEPTHKPVPEADEAMKAVVASTRNWNGRPVDPVGVSESPDRG
jgi:chromosome segregation ATPase